jgi:hypothetical protein
VPTSLLQLCVPCVELHPFYNTVVQLRRGQAVKSVNSTNFTAKSRRETREFTEFTA